MTDDEDRVDLNALGPSPELLATLEATARELGRDQVRREIARTARWFLPAAAALAAACALLPTKTRSVDPSRASVALGDYDAQLYLVFGGRP